MVHLSSDGITAPLEADEPPDVGLGTYPMSSSKPMDVVDSTSRRDSAKDDLSFSSDLRPIQEPCTSPHSFTSSVATDATPRFGCSPGYTDSLSGSPSSISSMMSIASYRRGDTADTEDDPDPDLYPVNETEEIDSHALASMDITDKPLPPSPTLQPGPTEPRRTQSAPVLSKPLKGRVFELLADEDDSGSSGISSPHDWDGEINEPPPPQPNVTPQDTVPPVPSPLCMSISGDATDVTKPSNIQVPDSASPGTTMPHASPKSPNRVFEPANRRSRRGSRSKKPLKSAMSSSDEERTGRPRHRERKKQSVRFCLEPQEQRTHSPVDYDRKAHPVHNRLCHDDLRELRDLHMPMDLLASRWSALKLPQNGQKNRHYTIAPELPAYDMWHSTAMQSLSSEQPLPASGPTCLPATEAENTAAVPTSSMVAPAATAHRDPVAELKAVRPPTPTYHGLAGVNRSYAVPQEPHQGLSSSLTDSLAARFGLTKPPPPLPGVGSAPGPRRTQSDSKLYPMPQSIRPISQNSNSMNSSAGFAAAHANGYESPSTDLGDYGSEYAMMGSGP